MDSGMDAQMDDCPWNGPHSLEGGILERAETGSVQGWPRFRILGEGGGREGGRQAGPSPTYRKML